MTKIFIILPTQLFKNNSYLDEMDIIFLIEEPYYFNSHPFHRQKLILHRASMKYYYDYLKDIYNNKIIYIEFDNLSKFLNKKYNKNENEFYMYDPIDNEMIDKYSKFSKIKFYDTPAFLETRKDLEEYRNKYTNKKNYYHDRSFYRWQRKRLNILMKDEKTPIENTWSFDKENRNKYDKDYEEGKIKIYNNNYIEEAREYVIKNFNDNFGNIDNFYYPITFEDVSNHLKNFIKNRLETFGKYQDGISKKVIFGSHSILSPLLNIGLITPDIIIKEVLKYYKNNENNENSKLALITVEAFLRQLIGWRSYVRFIYIYHGKEMIDMNYLNHKNKVPNSWYDNNSNIEIKIIDDMIKKVYEYAYLHHIERLMIMGNIGLLLQIDPKELYEWFMICFIDAYEWVMIPNVFGMSQYSITNISMMTRPYFSSSNYIKKMSDYKNEKWFKKWDDLYWNLLNKHREIFKKIYSISNQIKLLDKRK